MKDPNKIKEISKRKFNVVLGIFLALFSIVLFINHTIFPRIFTFAVAYAFGMGSYLVYIAMYLIGMSLIFNFKFPKNKMLIIVFGTFFLVVGGLILSSYISINRAADIKALEIVGSADKKLISYMSDGSNEHFFKVFNSIFFNVEEGKNYLTASNINMFSKNYPLGGGIVGIALLGSGNQLFNNSIGGLFFAIFAFILAAGIYAIPFVKVMIALSKAKKHVVVEDEVIDITSNEKVPEKPEVYEEYPQSDYDEPKLSDNSFYLNNYDSTENGVFSRPVFSLGGDQIGDTKDDNSANTYTPVAARPAPQVSPSPVVPPVRPTVEPARAEQLSIDFNEPLNEDLVVRQPQFNEPVPQASAPVAPSMAAQQPQAYATQPVAPQAPKERVKWIAPSSSMLETYETASQEEQNNAVANERQLAINEVFNSFNIGARVDDYIVGSSVTRFNIKYEANVSSRSVNNIVPDISIRLGGVPARFTPIVEGQTTSGLEVPNACITTVSFREVYDGLPDVKKHPLAVAFGKNISGKIISADYDEFPHMLVAGTTGSGKSIFVNSIIATLIMRNSPDDLKVVLVDPKTVEMTRYKDMPHLLRPILYTADEALAMGKKLVEEMERRYKLFAETGATNIKEFNKDVENGITQSERLPYILFVLDEYADLIDQCKELSLPVVSLAQKARACGIHLLISTQRPSTNVVTGTIKANLPTHVALMTSNSTDSITIIGEGGAEKLLGKGDMLVQSPLVSRVGAVRLQGCYASRDEIIRVVKYLKQNYQTVYDPKFLNLEEEAEQSAEEYKASPDFAGSKDGDEEKKYQTIKDWVMSQDFMSISRIQRECAVGFNRAGRFFTRMQQEGVVDTKVEGNKGCKVLIQDKFGKDADVGSSEVSYFREDD